jgi:NTP pyrophosphatase (non-canonical NTP hydrolase)
MTNEEYTQRVLARASNEFHGELIDYDDMIETFKQFNKQAVILDHMKKAIFYGRAVPNDKFFGIPVENPMDSSGYAKTDNILHAIIGICTEAGELSECITSGNDMDEVNFKEELGDLMWYIALALHSIDSSITECLEINDAKLEKRFGKTFSEEAANNRDLDGERQVLEGGSE